MHISAVTSHFSPVAEHSDPLAVQTVPTAIRENKNIVFKSISLLTQKISNYISGYATLASEFVFLFIFLIKCETMSLYFLEGS